MERLIAISIALFLTFYAAQFFFLMTAIFIEGMVMNGKLQVIIILILTAIETVLFFICALKLGEKIIVRE